MSELPLPLGFSISVDADTKTLDETTLFGGSPARVMRLSAGGLAAWQQLLAGPIATREAATLGRRMTDAGLAHPEPPTLTGRIDATIIIPVRDRATMLDRCLTALGPNYPVVVVDDGSVDPAAIAAVARVHGARVVRREMNGGPGRARDTGLGVVDSEFVAFIDSDCVPTPGWIDRLSPHLSDPRVAAVAPRIVAIADDSALGRYAAAKGSLDLGDRAARVVPGTRVSYVPTAALLVRRSALTAVSPDGPAFDPALRYGEDVDLIWRLHEADWRIRYDPAVTVRHHEPETWTATLGRRFHYGTSAAPLARRHPRSMAPLVLQPWPTLTVAALLGRRPATAAACYLASVIGMRHTLGRAGLAKKGVLRPMATGVHQTWLGSGRYGTQFASPLLLGLGLAGSPLGARSRPGFRIAVASLLFGPAVTTWLANRSALDPVRFVGAQIADDAAYGAGVWAGCLRERTFTPLRPRVAWRPFRIGSRKTSSQ